MFLQFIKRIERVAPGATAGLTSSASLRGSVFDLGQSTGLTSDLRINFGGLQRAAVAMFLQFIKRIERVPPANTPLTDCNPR